MNIPSPYRQSEVWGRIKLVGYGFLPGELIATTGLVRKHEWVYQKGLGTSGAASIWRGRMIIEEIGIVLELPTTDAVNALGKLLDVMVPAPGRKPATFGVEHPQFALVGVTRISLKSYGVQPSAGNSWQMLLGVTEYSPTVKAKVGPADPAKLPGEPKPKDAIDVAIAQRQATIAKLGG